MPRRKKVINDDHTPEQSIQPVQNDDDDDDEQPIPTLTDDSEAAPAEVSLDTLREELFEYRLLYNAGRKANSWSAIKQSEGTPASFGERSRKQQNYQQTLQQLGQDPERMTKLRTALPTVEHLHKAASKKDKRAEAPANVIGSEAAYRAYRRRLEQDMPPFDHAAYLRQKQGAPHEVTSAVTERIILDMKKLDTYRQKNTDRRVRQATRRDDGISGDSGGNRTLNRMAKKSFASLISPIAADLNRGSALNY